MIQTTLTNFNVPTSTRDRFDRVCRISGRTRTSVLIEMMEDYIIHQGSVLKDRSKRIRMVDRKLGQTVV